MYTKFMYYDKLGRPIEQEIFYKDVKSFIQALAEASFTRDMGDVFIEKDGEWHLIDYYNDVR